MVHMWWNEKGGVKYSILCHLADSKTWRLLDEVYLHFTIESQNVHLGYQPTDLIIFPIQS